MILNPGSVGLPAYRDELPRTHRVETGTPHARYALLEGRAEGWSAELIQLSYDHGEAAARAALDAILSDMLLNQVKGMELLLGGRCQE